MTKTNLSPKERAHQLIAEALATGVRGALRDTLLNAQQLASPSTSTARADLEYRNLAQGAKLRCPAHPGLLMRHGKRTGKVWIFAYRDKATGKEREHQFGHYPAMGLHDARHVWADLRDRHKAGLPLSDEPETTLTIADLVDVYMEDYARQVKRSHVFDERLLNRLLVPAYGKTSATDFGHQEAAELLHRVHKTAPREAEKLRAVISTMFNFASGRTRKVLVTKPLLSPTHPNPVNAVLLPKRKVKNHKPTERELAAYATALTDQTIPCADTLRFQLLTMTRIAEAAQITWDEVDLDAGRWDLPEARAKNGHAHTILLSPQAQDLLRAIKADQEASNTKTAYVFPSPRDPRVPRTVNNVQHLLAQNRTKLGIHENFTSHSIRHAALTWAAENGCPREVRDRLSNHVAGGGIDAVYNAASLNAPAKDWWHRWANYLDQITTPGVVPLKGKAAR